MKEEKQYWIEYKSIEELRLLIERDLNKYLIEEFSKTTATFSWYKAGVTSKINECEAMKWYLRAAEKNNAKAQYAIAECYANGIGVDKDI